MTLLFVLQRWKWLVLMMMLGSALALVIAATQKPRYIASMTISGLGLGETAIQAGLSGGSSGVLQALRGITGAGAASLGDSDYGYFISLLNSDRTAELIAKDPQTLVFLFPTEWDEETRQWRRLPNWASGISALYDHVFFGQSYQPPNAARIKEKLEKIMSIGFDLESNQHNISVKGVSCNVARQIANKIFQSADAILKIEKARRYKENIAYLSDQLADPRNAALREDLSSALLLQHLRQISARSQLPLAVRVIDGPGCGPRPALPQPIAYVALGLLAGLIFGLLAILIQYFRYVRENQSADSAI